MLALLLGSLVIVQGCIVAYTAIRVRSSTVKKTTELLTVSGKKEAEELSRKMTRFIVTTQMLATTLEECNRTAPEARKDVLNMVRKTLEKTPGALAVWFVFEPNAFDGRDSEYTSDFNETGRYKETFIREGGHITATGGVSEKSLESDWYQSPMSTGKALITEPFTHSYSTNSSTTFFISCFIVPIKDKGKPIGVVGMDIDLDVFAKEIAASSLTENSYKTLFSNKGYTLYHPNKDLMGKNLAEIGGGKIANLDHILNSIANGVEEITIERPYNSDQDNLRGRLPVPLGEGFAPWCMSITVPFSDITTGANALIRNLLLTSLLGLILLGVIIFIISSRIVKPIAAISELIERFSTLNFSRDNSKMWLLKFKDKKDEIAMMVQSLLKMQGAINHFVHSVQKVSGNLSGSSESLAALAEETVASMEEVKASVDHVGVLSETNMGTLKEASTEVNEFSKGAAGAAEQAVGGAEVSAKMSAISKKAADNVKSMVEMIKSVGERSSHTMNSMSQVGNSVEAITSFVTTITSIADQTNLLALNAAIEAARAGEHGRGFAVVAEEVRKLAEESNSAAREVADLISSLKDNAASSTSSMKEVDQVVDEIVNVSDSAIANLEESLSQIGRVEDTIQNLKTIAGESAGASQHIASEIDQATKGTAETTEILENVKKGSDDTAQASEQVALEAQKLSSEAEALNTLLGQFQIDDNESNALVSS